LVQYKDMKRNFLYILILLLSFTFYTKSVFAAPPTGGYEPGETLDPNCAPGDADCIVTPLIAQDEGVDLSGNVLKLNFTGDGVSSSISSGVVTVNVPGGPIEELFPGGQFGQGSTLSSTGIGAAAGTSIGGNVFLGWEAGSDNVYSSIAIGSQAGSSDFISGISIGRSAGSDFSVPLDAPLTTSTGVILIGQNAGESMRNSGDSIGIGSSALNRAVNTRSAIAIGLNAGNNNGSSDSLNQTDNAIMIGSNTFHGGFSNSIALGTSAENTAPNQLLLASSYTNLSLRGVNYVLPGSGGGAGTVLTNDGTNNLSWSAIPDGSNITPLLTLQSTFELPQSYLNLLGYKESLFLKSSNQFTSIDVSNPYLPNITDSETLTSSSGNSGAMDIDTNTAVVSTGDNIDIFDISNTSNIVKTDTLSITEPYDIKIYGQYVYVLHNSVSNTLSVVDISDKQNVSIVNTVSLSFSSPRIISLENDTMVIGDLGEIQIIDVSNSSDPVHVETSNNLGSSYFFNNATIDGNYAYVSYNDGVTLELRVVDISDISTIVNYYSVETGGVFLVRLEKQGDYLIATGYGSGSATINMLNIEDPDNVSLVSSINADTDELTGTAIIGNRVFTADVVEVTNNLYTYNIGGIKTPSIISSVIKAGDITAQKIISNFAKIDNALSVGQGGIISSGLMSISPNFSTDQIALRAGSSFVTDGTAILRLQDANSTCDFDADTGSPTCGSDETLKKNISSIEGSLSKVLGLRPANYNWLTEEDEAPLQHGFIAQEVEVVFPHLVSENTWIDGTTRKFLNTGGMIPYIVGAIKDMYTEFKTNFVTKRVQVEEEICFDDVCLDKEKVLELLNESNISSSSNYNQDQEEGQVIESSENNSTLQNQTSLSEEQTQEETSVNIEVDGGGQATNQNLVEELLEEQPAPTEEQTTEETETDSVEETPAQQTTE